MRTPNHIAGGIVITGIMTSLWNINLFAEPLYLTTTIIGSILPDIDHTKSTIGKLTYPIAKHIQTKYGHRTITHSLIFLIGITFITLCTCKFFNLNNNYCFIIFFAIFSHILLDMVTISGVPLFYPFKKNPCVIPGNPNLRIRTGDNTKEGIVFFMFAILALTFQNLFTNGFWTTYNKQFNDIQHIYREYKNSPDLLNITYKYTTYNTPHQGKGYLVYAEKNQLLILTNNQLINLNKDNQGEIIENLKTTHTKKNLTFKTLKFQNLTIDSLNKILYQKFIQTGLIYSSQKTELNLNKDIINSTKFNLQNNYNPFLKNIITQDSLINYQKETQNYQEKQEKLTQNIQTTELKLSLETENLTNQNNEYLNLKNNQLTEKNKLNQTTDLYEINTIKKNLIEITNKLKTTKLKTSNQIPLLKKQIQDLKTQQAKPLIFSDKLTKQKQTIYQGEITYFIPPK